MTLNDPGLGGIGMKINQCRTCCLCRQFLPVRPAVSLQKCSVPASDPSGDAFWSRRPASLGAVRSSRSAMDAPALDKELGGFLWLGHVLCTRIHSGAPLSALRANLAASRSPIFRAMRPSACIVRASSLIVAAFSSLAFRSTSTVWPTHSC